MRNARSSRRIASARCCCESAGAAPAFARAPFAVGGAILAGVFISGWSGGARTALACCCAGWWATLLVMVGGTLAKAMVAPAGFVLYGGGGGRLPTSAEELCAACWLGFAGGAACGCAMPPAAYAVLVVAGALAPCSAWISSLSTSVLLVQRGDTG